MSTEISRLAVGTRVARAAAPHIRGTVAGYRGSSLAVSTDDGGSHTGPAHHRTWRELTEREALEEATAAHEAAKARLLGDATTVAAQQAEPFPPVASHNGQPSTDLLRAAAQGMAAHLHRQGNVTTTVMCSSGCDALSVTPYLFDDTGRMDEAALWVLVGILEHVIERGPRHNLTSWVVGS